MRSRRPSSVLPAEPAGGLGQRLRSAGVHQQRPAPRLRVPGPGRHGQPRPRPRRRAAKKQRRGQRDRRAGAHRQRRDAERMLDQSFAVVNVADFAGIPVFVDNQPVGERTARAARADRSAARLRSQRRARRRARPADGRVARPRGNRGSRRRGAAGRRSSTSRSSSALTLRLVLESGSALPQRQHPGRPDHDRGDPRRARLPRRLAPGLQQGRAEWFGQDCGFAFTRTRCRRSGARPRAR